MNTDNASYDNALELDANDELMQKAMNLSGEICLKILTAYYPGGKDLPEEKEEGIKHAVYDMLLVARELSDNGNEQLALISYATLNVLANLAYGIEHMEMMYELSRIEEGNGNDYNN